MSSSPIPTSSSATNDILGSGLNNNYTDNLNSGGSNIHFTDMSNNSNSRDFGNSTNFNSTISVNLTRIMNSIDSSFGEMDNNNTAKIKTEIIELEADPSSGFTGKVFLFFGLALSLVIIVVNSLTVYIIRGTPSLQTIQNKYIVSLAYADMLVGIALIEVYVDNRHGFDCTASIALLHSSVAISMINLIAIAIDRYVFIAKPFLHMRRFTSRFTAGFLVCQWIICLTYGFLPTFLFGLGKGKNCHPFFILHHTVITCTHLASYGLNVLVTGILYGLIARIAKQKGDQRMRANRYVMKTLENSTDKRNVDIGNNNIIENSRAINYKNPKDNAAKRCGELLLCCRKREVGESAECQRNSDSTNSNSCEIKGTTDKSNMKHTDEKTPSGMIGRSISTGSDNQGISSEVSLAAITSGNGLEELSSKQLDDNIEQNKNGSIINLEISVLPKNSSQDLTSATSEDGLKRFSPKSIADKTEPITTGSLTTSTVSDPSRSSTEQSTLANTRSRNIDKPTNRPHQTSGAHTTILPSSRIKSLRWMKQMVMVYGMFVICWSPSQIAALIYLLGASHQDPIYYLSWLGMANSAFNFYIYAFMNRQFRKVLKQKLKTWRWIPGIFWESFLFWLCRRPRYLYS